MDKKRRDLIAKRIASSKIRLVDNPNGGTQCWVIGISRPWIQVDGVQILMSRYILGIEKAGPKVVAMHTCDNPPCFNPAHLVAGTQSQNIKDSWIRGGQRRAYESRKKID